MIPPVGTRLCRACRKPIDDRESKSAVLARNAAVVKLKKEISS